MQFPKLVDSMNDITVLLPAKNEEAGIGLVIDEIQKYLPNARILVGDGCSTDRTVNICLEKKVPVIKGLVGGKGRAISQLIKEIDTPYTIMTDADATYPGAFLTIFLTLLRNREIDVVMGYRYHKEPGSMSAMNSFGNSCLSIFASILYFRPVQDVCTGMWGFKSDFLKIIDIESKGFTLEAELFSKAVRSRQRIVQIPIDYRKRLDGSVSKLRAMDGLKISFQLLKGVIHV